MLLDESLGAFDRPGAQDQSAPLDPFARPGFFGQVLDLAFPFGIQVAQGVGESANRRVGAHSWSCESGALKIGRNDACPCGSGKKYKKCCLGKMEAAPSSPSPNHLSTRQIKASPDDPTPKLPPYSLAKLVEKADLSGFTTAQRREMEEVKKASWTLEKIAAMSTEQLEKQLRNYGVPYSREDFLKESQDFFSAWQLSETWFSRGNLSCRGLEEDFVGLAACELWKRLLPERPSMEMVDDWLEQGCQVVTQDKCQACDSWWQAWRALYPRFSPQMRTMQSTEAMFQGTYLLFNWCQDFEMWLSNATLWDRRFAAMGEQYCREWLGQFTEEKAAMRVGFCRAWAEFTFRSGQVEKGRAILEQTLADYPKDPWSYIALADAYSHLFADRQFHLPFDLKRAREYLDLGFQRLRAKKDRTDLQERLDGLAEAVPVTQKPPPPPPGGRAERLAFP